MPSKDTERLPKGPLARELEQIVRNAEAAINARDFSLPSPHCWDHWSKTDLKASWSHGALTEQFANRATGVYELFEAYKALTTTWPEYNVTLTDTDTHVYQHGMRADVFVNAEVRGAPPEVVRTMVFVTSFAFQEDENRWIVVKLESMGGMDELGMW